MTALPPLERTDLDRRIWEEELEDFVPRRIFDVHTHVYRWDFYLDPNKETSAYGALLGDTFANANWEFADACDRLLMPGREVNRLALPFPAAVRLVGVKLLPRRRDP